MLDAFIENQEISKHDLKKWQYKYEFGGKSVEPFESV